MLPKQNLGIEISESIAKALNKVKSSGGNIGKQMFAVSMAMFNHRQVSGSECDFRLCHLQLRNSSRKCVFVNTRLPEQQFRMLRIDTGDVFNNIFNKYEYRPFHLKDMSLGEFAITYDTYKTTNTYEEDDCEDDELNENISQLQYIILLDGKGKMKERNRHAILRTCHFTPTSDPENYYYSLLETHLPFCHENELLSGFQNAREAFYEKCEHLKPTRPHINVEQFATIELELNEAIRKIVAKNLANNLQQNIPQEQNVNDNDILITVTDDISEDDLQQLQNNKTEDRFFEKAVQSLNIQQKSLFSIVSEKLLNDDREQVLMFITGGAGSGKTFTLKLLAEQIQRCSLTPLPKWAILLLLLLQQLELLQN